MHFTKWQACGNDFVFINAAENPDIKSISDQAKLICDRHIHMILAAACPVNVETASIKIYVGALIGKTIQNSCYDSCTSPRSACQGNPGASFPNPHSEVIPGKFLSEFHIGFIWKMCINL